MENLIEAIRAALADNAPDDARTAGAQACRTILTALETKPGQPMTAATANDPNSTTQVAQMVAALRGVPAEQLLDLAIARLRAALPAGTEPPRAAPVAFHIVQLPKVAKR
jgi:hypothetical protein